jgi:hypothetical protein
MPEQSRLSISGGMRLWLVLGAVLFFLGRCWGDDAPASGPLRWNLRDDFRPAPELTNPMADGHGFGTVWHFLRTTRHEGPIEARSWARDGRYLELREWQSPRFRNPRDGWTYQSFPSRPPAMGRNRTAEQKGVKLAAGDILLEPGPEAAIIIGWRSPAAATVQVKGQFELVDNPQDRNAGVRWYVERGLAPQLERGFDSTVLATGRLTPGAETRHGSFHIKELPVAEGEFLYFVLDALADGRIEPHTGDATRFDVTITAGNVQPAPAPSFEHEVLPILAANCQSCHGGGRPRGGLDLGSAESLLEGGQHGPSVELGHPDRSRLIDRVRTGEMPPGERHRLTFGEVELLWQWIRAQVPEEVVVHHEPPAAEPTGGGDRAVDHDHWAFNPPRKQPLPKVQATNRVKTAVDQFVLARLEAAGLGFSPDADRTALIRRASFDLLGLPPAPSDVEQFLNDPRPDAYARMVDRLLASPRYGERWGRHWLDVAGYVDVAGLDGVVDFVLVNEGIWRYRDYVVRAFNQDKPFDRFLSEQLAGDELVDWKSAEEITPEILEPLTATGFLRSVVDLTQDLQHGVGERYKVLFRVMDVVSTSLMGLTFECARCHDHKYEPISQHDYYALMACFEPAYNVHNGWVVGDKRHLSDRPFDEQQAINRCNAQVDAEAQLLRDERTKINQNAAIEEKEKKRRMDDLTVRIEGVEAKLKEYNHVQAVWDCGPIPVSRMFRRGDWKDRGVRVDPSFPPVLDTPETTRVVQSAETAGMSSGRRLAFARWLTRDDHPLTARVMVNRSWHHLFGRGIVATPGNLGRSGSPPSHPELLDWLAVEFAENGWSLKRLHRLLMMSTVYRQTSRRETLGQTSLAETRDPENRLLWRSNLRRLDAEVIRDAVLAVCDVLDGRLGGPPVMLKSPPSGLLTVEAAANGTDHLRRSLYLFARRNYPMTFLEVFDAPIMPVNCTRRDPGASVLQSLTFLNADFVVNQAGKLAATIDHNSPGVSTETVRTAYIMVLSRPPTDVELQMGCDLLSDQVKIYGDTGMSQPEASQQALVDLCHMLLCSNEFLHVE